MLYHKQKVTVTISGGSGSANTAGMKGCVEQLIVTPTASSTTWDMTIADRDGDTIMSRASETGTLYYIDGGIPVGLEGLEKFKIAFANVTANQPISVIFRVREAQ